MPQLKPSQLKTLLEKIGFKRKPVVDLANLKELVEKFIFTFPFETISLHDSTLDTDPARQAGIALNDIFERSIKENRGGNCVSLNLLLQAMLESIGFNVTPIIADTIWGSDEPRGERSKHCATVVALGEEQFLIDGGFGSVGLLSPISLKEGEYTQFSERFKIKKSSGYDFKCQVWNDDKWETLYGFNVQKASPAEYANINRLQTNPLDAECSFSQLMLCTKPFKTEHGNGRVRICNNKVTIYSEDGTIHNQTITSQKKLIGLFSKHFDINLQGHPIRFTKKALADFQEKHPEPILHTYPRRTKQTAVKVPPRNKAALSNNKTIGLKG